ncbi:hypothetical protein LA080_012019 [Diaporthe eres]|nr:hypothetical protein LA080_012019 [Diaporthe eres]
MIVLVGQETIADKPAINFDHWTYQNVKSMITTKSTANLSIFGLAFVRGSTSSTSTQSLDSFQMDDTSVFAMKSSITTAMLGYSLPNLSPNSVSYLRQKAIQAAEEDAAEDRDPPHDGKPATS